MSGLLGASQQQIKKARCMVGCCWVVFCGAWTRSLGGVLWVFWVFWVSDRWGFHVNIVEKGCR